MRVLTTGGTGFIGKAVLDNLLENIEKVEILNLTRSTSKQISTKVEFFNCDLSNPNTYLKKVIEFKPDVVIHLAWEGIPDFSLEKCNKNILISTSFIEYVSKIKSCKKIIVTGSCFEYNNKIGACKECDIVTPKDYFTFAKKTILSFLELECNKNNIVFCWVRLFYVYGPNQRSGSLIPLLIETIKSNNTPDLRTPKNANDFIFVDDVAIGISKLISEKIHSGIYNLGSGKSTPVTEVSRLVELSLVATEKLTNMLILKTIETEKSIDFWADMDKTFSMLNWQPQTNLINGVEKTINFLKYKN
jgi:UDP-glucose 4-epimerase